VHGRGIDRVVGPAEAHLKLAQRIGDFGAEGKSKKCIKCLGTRHFLELQHKAGAMRCRAGLGRATRARDWTSRVAGWVGAVAGSFADTLTHAQRRGDRAEQSVGDWCEGAIAVGVGDGRERVMVFWSSQGACGPSRGEFTKVAVQEAGRSVRRTGWRGGRRSETPYYPGQGAPAGWGLEHALLPPGP